MLTRWVVLYKHKSEIQGICDLKMARSDEAQWWFNAVYEAVQEIPPGHVTSYGHIALLLGRREYNQFTTEG